MRLMCIAIFLLSSFRGGAQEGVKGLLGKRNLSQINKQTEGWVRYNKYAPHFTEGRAILREDFKNEDSVMDKRFFCVDVIAKDSQIVWWKLSTFRDEEVIHVDSFRDGSVKIPPVPLMGRAEPAAEQIAFDYFVHAMDSIRFFNSDTTFNFDKTRSILHFAKQSRSGPYSFVFQFSDKKGLAFFGVKTEAELKTTPYYTELGTRNIVATQHFISTDVSSFNELEDTRKEKTDMMLKMWNCLLFKGNYYVYLTVSDRLHLVTDQFLIKIDKSGKPVGMIRAIHSL